MPRRGRCSVQMPSLEVREASSTLASSPSTTHHRSSRLMSLPFLPPCVLPRTPNQDLTQSSPLHLTGHGAEAEVNVFCAFSLPTHHQPPPSPFSSSSHPPSSTPTNPQVFRLSHSSVKMVRLRVTTEGGGYRVCGGGGLGLLDWVVVDLLLSFRKKKHDPASPPCS